MATGLSLVAGEGVFTPGPADEPPPAGEGRRLLALPWPEHATLSEVFAASPRDGGATGFLLGRLPSDRPLLWVQERMAILEAGRVYPPGLGLAGLIHVEARDARDALWAMEEGLRCASLGVVVGELWGDPRALDFTATRRLAVAAERYGVAAILIRLGGHANLSGARMRWHLTSAPSQTHPFDHRAPGPPQWDAELFRARGLPPGQWRTARDAPTNERTAYPFAVVAEAGDRALGANAGLRRAG